MDKFITLHRMDCQYNILASAINMFYRIDNDSLTMVRIGSELIAVNETPDEIKALITAATR